LEKELTGGKTRRGPIPTAGTIDLPYVGGGGVWFGVGGGGVWWVLGEARRLHGGGKRRGEKKTGRGGGNLFERGLTHKKGKTIRGEGEV